MIRDYKTGDSLFGVRDVRDEGRRRRHIQDGQRAHRRQAHPIDFSRRCTVSVTTSASARGGTAEDGNEAGERGARGRSGQSSSSPGTDVAVQIKGSMGHIGGGTATYRGEGRGRESRAPPRHDRREDDRGRYEGIRRERSRSRDRDRRRDEDRDRRRRRDGSRDRRRDGDRDADRDRDRHRKKDRKRERSRSRDRNRKKDRRRDRSRSRSRDASRRDGGDERRREDAPTSGGLDAPRKPGGLEAQPPRDAPGKDSTTIGAGVVVIVVVVVVHVSVSSRGRRVSPRDD